MKRNCNLDKQPNGKYKFVSTHGLSDHPLYRKWNDVKNRCFNEKVMCYKYYGGRGITMCDEWKNDFQLFYDWCINNGWRKELQIDRIDNNLNYSPDNCRFVSRSENCRNKNSNHYLEYLGESKTIVEWAEIYNLPMKELWQRIKRGWSVERALNEKRGEYAERRKGLKRGTYKKQPKTATI